MSESPINIAVIGTGRIGRLHAENLAYRLPQATLVAVADIVLEAAQQTAAACRVPVAVQDYRQLLENRDLDAVVICSATNTHAHIVEEAAAAGKHVFCEKPIDLDLARIDRALAAVERAGVKLQVGFNRRFDPNAQRMRELIAAGRIGQPHLLHIVSRDPGPPPIEYIRVSGGIFVDMAIHDFDMARFLIGSEVEEVFASGAVMVDPAIGEAGDIDTAITILRFANGVIGTVDNSRCAAYGYDQRLEVFGSGGSLMGANKAPDQVIISDGEAIHQSKPLYFFLERYADSFLVEMRAFLDAVQHDGPVAVSGQDGRAPVVIGLAAGKSYRENRPVKLSEIG